MSWGLLNAAILAGLVGAALPLVIHLLNRRRGDVLDWGAMQFLEPGRRSRRRIRLAEILLMAARMALLTLVVLALARPFWTRTAAAGAGGTSFELGGPPRDIVLIIDVSLSMQRKRGDTTSLERAVEWARSFSRRCRVGDSIAVLLSGDGLQRLIDPPSYDLARVDELIGQLKPARGASDLPAALADAFRILERTENPGRDVIVLTDGQRYAWRPGELGRWSLLRALHRRMPVPPRIWSIAMEPESTGDRPNAAVGALSVSRSLVTPGLPLEVTTQVENAGPGAFSGAAVLLVDEKPASGAAQAVGPIPAGGRTPLRFRTSLNEVGSHLLSVRLLGGDALAGDDISALPVQVTPAIKVLLVNGEPGAEPFSGETDFLRAALAPSEDESPQFRVQVIMPQSFDARSLEGVKVAVLANVERITFEQSAAIGEFLDAGGGILVAPGDRTDATSWHNLDWMPARLGAYQGNTTDAKIIAHPAPLTFSGPLMTAFGQGDAPALREAGFFAYQKLDPSSSGTVFAGLDTGDPWLVERARGRGRILVLSTSIDAEAGTLPVNPDFVPLVHEWVFHLAGGGEPLLVRPGEPLFFPLEAMPPAGLSVMDVETPGGTTGKAEVIRTGSLARARFGDTAFSGIYRLTLPVPPGGSMYGAVARDDHESDMAPLAPDEAARLAEGWPLELIDEATAAQQSLFSAGPDNRHEVWRLLVLAALGGLCVEIYLTRRLVRVQSGAVDEH